MNRLITLLVFAVGLLRLGEVVLAADPVVLPTPEVAVSTNVAVRLIPEGHSLLASVKYETRDRLVTNLVDVLVTNAVDGVEVVETRTVPVVSVAGIEWGRSLVQIRIEPVMSDGSRCQDYALINRLNAPIVAWNAELATAAAEIGVDWATATGAQEVAASSRALLRVIGSRLMSGPTLDAWVAATHAALMSVVAAELGGSP